MGEIILTSDGENITSLSLSGQGADLAGAMENTDAPIEAAKKWLAVYFSGDEPDFMPPIKFIGTAFQKEVWTLLREIPYGKTVSYKSIADKIAWRRGGKMSAQAVGGAVGKNPVAIMVPCHRVIGTDGSLVGYAGGLDLKRALLAIEQGKQP